MIKNYRYINLMIIVLVSIILFLFIFSFINLGRLIINTPPNSVIILNNIQLPSTNIKLKPGTYNLTIKSQGYKDFSQSIKINTFKTTIVTNQSSKLTDEEIFTQTLRLNTLTNNPNIIGLKRFNDNWLVGSVGLGSASPAVVHLEDNQWQIIYYGNSNYINRMSEASSDVRDYVNKLRVTYTDN